MIQLLFPSTHLKRSKILSYKLQRCPGCYSVAVNHIDGEEWAVGDRVGPTMDTRMELVIQKSLGMGVYHVKYTPVDDIKVFPIEYFSKSSQFIRLENS